MKKIILTLALASVLAFGGPALADICTVDAVPAATLLLPHFEVDLDGGADGFNTLFSVNNASDAPVLAHVTFWTDYTIPTIDFDVYLTGFDVQTFSLRDIFLNGTLPQTGPNDALSNRGDFSDAHITFPGCAGGLPIGNLPETLRTNLLIPAHTGQPVPFGDFGGRCAGDDYGDNIARGHITVDYVTQCSTDFPNTPGYFSNVAGFENVLWGDFFYVDPANNFAQGETLVHVEACTDADSDAECLSGQVLSDDNYTFYGRYVNWDGSDRREPLANIFATRFLGDLGAFDGTELVCWRDSKYDPSPFTCGGSPAGFPLSQEQVVIFDEEENPSLVPETNISPGIPGEQILVCPRESQFTEVGSSDLPVEFDFGWLFLNLNQTQTQALGNAPQPVSQAYVGALMSASGRFSVGFDAIQLASACDGLSITLDEDGTTIVHVGTVVLVEGDDPPTLADDATTIVHVGGG